MATLFINRNDSLCGDCNRGADPHELKHQTQLSWGGKQQGCGAIFDNMSSHYYWPGSGPQPTGFRIEEACMRKRPDLDFVCGEDVIFKAPHEPYQLTLWPQERFGKSILEQICPT